MCVDKLVDKVDALRQVWKGFVIGGLRGLAEEEVGGRREKVLME